MLSNYHTLRYITSDIHQKLRGRTIKQVFSQEKNILVLSFTDVEHSLLFSAIPDANTFYLHPRFSHAKRNSAHLLKDCWGDKIHSISIHPSDRVVAFRLESGSFLEAQFFGPKANVLFVDEKGIIVDSFKQPKRTRGTKYQPANNRPIHDMTVLSTEIARDQNSTIGAILKKALPTFGSTLVRETMYRAGIPASMTGAQIDSTMFSALRNTVQAILAEITSPLPRVYVHNNDNGVPSEFSLGASQALPIAFSIVQLRQHEKLREILFDDVHEAIRFFISRRRATTDFDKQKSALTATLKRQQDKAQRTITAIQNDLQSDARAEDYAKFASLIIANLHKLSKGLSTTNLGDGKQEIKIPLDFKLSPAQNAQKYFEKAKKSRVARQTAKRRLQELKSKTAIGETLLEAVEEISSQEELRNLVTTRSDEFDSFGIGKKSKQRAATPFRIFNVDGGSEVWVGKSSANNDLLTLKYGKPNDLWFHARGSSGSHVLLKINTGGGEPSKKAKTQAAAIAAYYSKMKNAKMVPVAMTQRKYVRKPKGASPGTVTLEREQVIFAEPALPSF
ncbi:MAG: NFACT RNA binding domain-containing protein [Ignavibacteria bacterium]|nr:NFACT RNA binding domain-containing protein [Ignavibacteria bacterium]